MLKSVKFVSLQTNRLYDIYLKTQLCLSEIKTEQEKDRKGGKLHGAKITMFSEFKKEKKSALIYLCSLHLWLFTGQIRTTQTGFYIGAGTGGQNFKGYIDEVRSMGGLLDHYIVSFKST